MFRLDTRRPGSAAPPAALLDAALRQAERDAGDVPGAYAEAPWGFRPAPPEAQALLEVATGRSGSWIVVTCRQNDAASHTRERCLTAVQRYLLSLEAEGVEATWIGSGLPMDLARAAGLASGDGLIGAICVGPA